MANLLVGQEKLLQSIQLSIDDNQFSHATMLSGLSGYGGLSLALFISSYLVCRDRRHDGPCGQCSPCKKSFKFIHPDIHYAYPVVSTTSMERKNTTSVHFLKQWREALNQNPYMDMSEWTQKIVTTSAKPDINVAECNEIIRQLNLQSFEDGPKVQIIWMAEYLGNNGNRLLKLIEEPPQDTYILLICEDTQAVLNTVQSRCRLINIPRIDQKSVTHTLIDNYELSEERASQIAFLSEGDFGMALGLVGVDSTELLGIGLTLLTSCYRRDVIRMRDWVDAFLTFNSQEQKAILFYILKLLRELLHAEIIGKQALRFSKAEMDAINRTPLWDVMDVTQVEKISNIINESLFLLGRNAHVKTLMYNSCLEIESTLNTSVFK